MTEHDKQADPFHDPDPLPTKMEIVQRWTFWDIMVKIHELDGKLWAGVWQTRPGGK